jgi:hypothetical protein
VTTVNLNGFSVPTGIDLSISPAALVRATSRSKFREDIVRIARYEMQA